MLFNMHESSGIIWPVTEAMGVDPLNELVMLCVVPMQLVVLCDIGFSSLDMLEQYNINLNKLLHDNLEWFIKLPTASHYFNFKFISLLYRI